MTPLPELPEKKRALSSTGDFFPVALPRVKTCASSERATIQYCCFVAAQNDGPIFQSEFVPHFDIGALLSFCNAPKKHEPRKRKDRKCLDAVRSWSSMFGGLPDSAGALRKAPLQVDDYRAPTERVALAAVRRIDELDAAQRA